MRTRVSSAGSDGNSDIASRDASLLKWLSMYQRAFDVTLSRLTARRLFRGAVVEAHLKVLTVSGSGWRIVGTPMRFDARAPSAPDRFSK